MGVISEMMTNATLAGTYIVQPVASETLIPINTSGLQLLTELGRRIYSVSGDIRETSLLFSFKYSCHSASRILTP